MTVRDDEFYKLNNCSWLPKPTPESIELRDLTTRMGFDIPKPEWKPPNYRVSGCCYLCKHGDFGQILKAYKCNKHTKHLIAYDHVCDEYELLTDDLDTFTEPMEDEQDGSTGTIGSC